MRSVTISDPWRHYGGGFWSLAAARKGPGEAWPSTHPSHPWGDHSALLLGLLSLADRREDRKESWNPLLSLRAPLWRSPCLRPLHKLPTGTSEPPKVCPAQGSWMSHLPCPFGLLPLMPRLPTLPPSAAFLSWSPAGLPPQQLQGGRGRVHPP